jgi:hypothetical protein
MARVFYTYEVTLQAAANPRTICQFAPDANMREVLHELRVYPHGATAAEVALILEIGTQTTAGNQADDSAARVLQSPTAGETLQGAVLKFNTGAEPAGWVRHFTLEFHQMVPTIWVPPNAYKELVMEGGSRWGFVYSCANYRELTLSFSMEQ